MKAAWYARNGEAREVLTVGEIPTPTPGPGEVRVKLATSGINPSDVKARRGRPVEDGRCIPHSDGAGVIDMVGAGVPAHREGEHVWIWNGQWKRQNGTAAEYITLPQEQAVPLPDNVGFDVGACLGIPALTALRAVQLLGEIQDKNVLVTGAASVVSQYIAQLAAMKGANLIGTISSDEKADMARRAGVAQTINYKTEPVLDRVKELTNGRGADAVVDLDFSSLAPMLGKGLVAPHGTIVSYGSNTMADTPIPFRPMLFASLNLHLFLVYELKQHDRAHAIETLTELLREDRLTHLISHRHKLEDIAAAHEAVENGVLGNVVIEF